MEINTKTAPVVQEKDRNAISLDLMNRMKLHGMAAAFSESLTSTIAESMTPDGFLSWLLAREWDYRSAAAIQRLIKNASFRYDAFIEQVDYAIGRGLDRNQMERLASLEFIRQGQTCSSRDRREPARASLPQRWGLRHVRTAYAPSMPMRQS